MTSAFAWKLVLAAALAAAILAGALAKAPRRPVPLADLRALVAGALVLYGVGLAASLSHRTALAAVVYCSGIAASALAGWLSRAPSGGDPPSGAEPGAGGGPRRPEGIDWDARERELQPSGVPREPLLPSSHR